MGLVGLSVFLAMVGALFVHGFRGLTALRAARSQGLALALQACLAAALTSGLFDHYFFRFPHSLALFWLYAALLWLATALPEAAPAPAPEGVPPGVDPRASRHASAGRRPADAHVVV